MKVTHLAVGADQFEVDRQLASNPDRPALNAEFAMFPRAQERARHLSALFQTPTTPTETSATPPPANAA